MFRATMCPSSTVFLTLAVFLTLTEDFPCLFLGCKANAKVKPEKMGHGSHSSTLGCICVVRLLFVLFYVLLVCKCILPPGDNPTAVNKYIISKYRTYTFLRVGQPRSEAGSVPLLPLRREKVTCVLFVRRVPLLYYLVSDVKNKL
jgi:hypothetical protein